MSIEPVTVVVTNKINKARTIRWTGKGPVWIEARGTVTIPYEPWSCASKAQKEAIRFELENNIISMVLNVATAGGTCISIPYDPGNPKHKITLPAVATDPDKAVETPAIKPYKVDKQKARVITTDGSNHIVMTNTHNADSLNLGFKSEIVQPPTSSFNDNFTASKYAGFSMEKMGIAGALTTDVLEKKTNKEAEPPKEKELENDKAPDADDVNTEFTELVEDGKWAEASALVDEVESDNAIKAKFAVLVAERKWTEALDLLIEKFGKDKVTFTTRTIMTMKDYDAIVEKYALDKE